MATSRLAEHHDQINEALRAGVSRRKLAAQYGVAKSTMDEYVAKHAAGAVPDQDAEPIGPTPFELLEHEVRELRSRERRIRNLDIQSERIALDIQAAITAAPERYVPPALPERDDYKHHVQALMLSDLHAGEIVVPEQVSGMNEYSWDILVKRMDGIFKGLLSYQDNRPYPIDELQIWALGDMTSGRQHQELAETNEFPMAEQAFRVGMLLGQWIEALVPHYPKITVYAVPGNHGRVNKPAAAKNVFDNFDWIAYQIAKVHLSEYRCVELNISQGNTAVAEIAGQNVLLFHGDGIRSTMVGFPGGGVTRRCTTLRAQYANFGQRIDGFALGHFHQAHALPGPIWVNGSVKGPDEWCLKQFGSSDPPEQLLLTFNADKGRRTDVSYINP